MDAREELQLRYARTNCRIWSVTSPYSFHIMGQDSQREENLLLITFLQIGVSFS